MSGPGPFHDWQDLAEAAGSSPSGSLAHPGAPEQSSGDATDRGETHIMLTIIGSSLYSLAFITRLFITWGDEVKIVLII